jgi:hypothetical protein
VRRPAGHVQREPVRRPTTFAVAATAIVLAIAADIHGVALVTGIVLALVTTAATRTS